MTQPSTTLRALRDYRLYLPNPTFANPAWEGSRCRVLILRLSPFNDVQRSTPHLFLAREVRTALPDAFIDMAFLPRPADAEALAAAGLPLIIGTQSHRPLREFDLVLVSNSWLLEQVNLPFLLSRSGVPTWSRERGEELPAIILGGSNGTAAHALVKDDGDCVADAIFFGEGEGSVGVIARLWAAGTGVPARAAKTDRLARTARKVPGFWTAGSLPESLAKVRAPVESLAPAQVGAPILPGPEAATARVSITLGCPCLCSFCFEGHDRKPFRAIPARQILDAARELKIASGASTLEVESFNFNTHGELALLMDGLNRMFHRVNFMSQRVDILARTPGLLDLELAADKRSFTLGVEGISARLRRFLHKSLADEDIRTVVEAMHERGAREVKLFYMLTGRETEADLDEFAGFVKWVKQVRQKSHAGPRLVFSFGYLVRMPFTPLRHDALVLDERAWRSAAGRVKSTCETNGFEFRLAMSFPEYTATQVLARGGPSLHDLLEQLSEAGCVTDSGLNDQARHALARWLEANAEAISAEQPLGFPFPLGFLDNENSRRFLHGQYESGKKGLDAGYDDPLRAERAAVPRTAVTALRDLMTRKHRLKPLFVATRLPREAAGMGAPWIDAWLLRTYLERRPEQADNVLSVTEAFTAGTGVIDDEVPWFGETVAAVIAWDPENFTGDEDGPLGARLRDFDLAAARTLQARIELPADVFPHPAERLAEFLRDAHAPVTLSRRGAMVTFAVGEKALKKRLLLAGTCRSAAAGAVLELSIGTRPFLGEWLKSFGRPGAVREALVEILSLF
jgi:radical SAM superfamily enzyme YgiQ (UPF0313 family)